MPYDLHYPAGFESRTVDVPLERKILSKNLGGIPLPELFPTEAMSEGAAVRLAYDQSDATGTPNGIAVADNTEGAYVIGLAMQSVYDDSTYPTHLKGYTQFNNTSEALGSKRPIGVLSGYGIATTLWYAGEIVRGEQAFLGPNGLLVGAAHASAATGTNALPVYFMDDSPDGGEGDVALAERKPVKIRYHFPLDVAVATAGV